MLLDQIEDIQRRCMEVHRQYEVLRHCFPLIRIWMNHPDGRSGAVYVGRVDFTDTIKGSWPFKNNVPGQGVLQLRDDHYLAVWMKQVPNNSDLRKNILITVDFYGGRKRWSGLLEKWNIRKRDGIEYFEATFNDDLTFLQYLLAPPNPLTPINLIQFPRNFTLAGPAKWAISTLIILNLIRVEGNLWTVPDDPFDLDSWVQGFDWTQWQCFVKADSFLLDDSSLWTFLASRMNPVDSVIADALEDAQLTIEYRRIITDDGETADIPGVPRVQNGALLLQVVDNSNARDPFEGTFFEGSVVSGFARSVIEYGGGFVEDVLATVTDDQTIQPDEYYRPGFMGTIPKTPWLVIRDNEYTPIESSDLSWGPAKAVSVVIGGSNPTVDAIERLAIEVTGNLLGYFLLGGFSSLGDIAADVIMPFIVGTVLAWVHWKNTGRAQNLGWISYWETFQAGADNNVWSLAALGALRGGFLSGASETDHQMALHESWVMPGVHFDVGHRVGSTSRSRGLEQIIFVDRVSEMTAAWDNSGDIQPYTWEIRIGRSERNTSVGERLARLAKKFSEAINNIGVKLVQR